MKYFMLLLMTSCSFFAVPPDNTIPNSIVPSVENFLDKLPLTSVVYVLNPDSSFTTVYCPSTSIFSVREAGGQFSDLKIHTAINDTQAMFEIVCDSDDTRVGRYLVLTIVPDVSGDREAVQISMPRNAGFSLQNALDINIIEVDSHLRVR